MVEEKYRTPNYIRKNQTLDWLATDTEVRYNLNLKNRYKELEKYGWIDTQFTYKFNSHGFRSDEFSNEPTLLALGCSFTLGVGVPIEYSWPQILARRLGLKCANLGVDGGSYDTIFRIFYKYITVLNPKIVVLMGPPEDRFEVNYYSDVRILSTWHLNNHLLTSTFDDFVKLWISSQNNSYFNQQKNILAINHLCRLKGIKIVTKNYNELYTDDFIIDLGRDLAHMGIKSHSRLAETFLLEI